MAFTCVSGLHEEVFNMNEVESVSPGERQIGVADLTNVQLEEV